MRLILTFLLVVACALQGAAKERKTLLVIADGIPRDVVERMWPELPGLQAVAERGGRFDLYTGGEIGAYNETPTISAVGYANILTGTWVNKHRVTDNDIACPNRHYEHLFALLRASDRSARTAVFSTWADNRLKLLGAAEDPAQNPTYCYDGMENDPEHFPHKPDGSHFLDIDRAVADSAATMIRECAPDLTWVYLEYPDEAGHRYGNGPEFDRSVRCVDRQVARLYDAVTFREQAYGEEWGVVVVTDHGRNETGLFHSWQTPRERSCWIVTNLPANEYLRSGNASLVDVVPTIVRFMGIEVPRDKEAEFDGIPLTGRVSGYGLRAYCQQDSVLLTWNVLDPAGKARVWRARTNEFARGGKDDYELVATVPVKNGMVRIPASEGTFDKVVVEMPHNLLGRWVEPNYLTYPAAVSHAGGRWTIHGVGKRVVFDESDFSLRVLTPDRAWDFMPSTEGDVVLAGPEGEVACRLSEAGLVSVDEYRAPYGKGIRIRTGDFAGAPGPGLDLLVTLDGEQEDLVWELIPHETPEYRIVRCSYPGMIDPAASDYTVLPIIQGLMIPRNWDRKVSMYDQESWRCYTTGMTMPIWGHIRGNSSALALIETPYDAGYSFRHTPGKAVEVHVDWYASLGRMDYNRKIRYCFIPDGGYVAMAKRYRDYLREHGQFVTLREKIARTPSVGRLVGSSVVHTSILYYIKNSSQFYETQDPAKNHELTSFETRASQIEALCRKGAEKPFVHLDGWGARGYDNLHPDVLPPCPEAGGWPGLRRLASVCDSLGCMLTLHDNYRDYYYDAASYRPEWAVSDEQGRSPFVSIWFGGEQSALCGAFYMDFLRRNYEEMQRHDVKITGAYLDVFSSMMLDECFHPDHRMSRRQNMRYRAEALDYIRSLGMVVSSEEVLGWATPYVDIVHHSPYLLDRNQPDGTPVGVPVPLVNLVYHDSVFIPWTYGRDHWGRAWGMQFTDFGFYNGLLNGGIPYLPVDATEGEIDKAKIMSRLHRRVALLEMVDHRYLDGDYRVQQTTFSDGTTVTVDFSVPSYEIKLP